MGLYFDIRAIANIRLDSPIAFIPNYGIGATATSIPLGPSVITLEYANGEDKKVVDDVAIMVAPYSGYDILYRVGDDVYYTRQTEYLRFNGERGTIDPYR